MTIALIIMVSLATAFYALICKAVYASIKEMLDPDSIFSEPSEEIDNKSDEMFKKRFNETNTWAQYHGLKFEKYVDCVSKTSGKTINCMFWLNENRTLVFTMYYVGGETHFEFVTAFENDYSLTTSSSKEGGGLPSLPTSFVQNFPGLTLNETWANHAEAERFIEIKFGSSRIALDGDILSEVKESMIKETHFVMSLFLWQLRAPYWFFIRRNLVQNKKVSEKFA